MIPGIATIKRRLLSLGSRVLRTTGLLPGGVPNRLGDDAKWRHRSFDGDVVVFFGDTPGGLYQLRAWYGPLRELHVRHGVTIVCMDSRTASAIRSELPVPVMTISQESFLDEIIARSDVKLFLYVNYTPTNFTALRIRSVIHVSLLHGDSDKSVSVSNQVKAFDYSFVAGQAAVDRLDKYTALFDSSARCKLVGRPQLDTDRRPSAESTSDSPTVLYAPTWEGGHDTVSYGSVVSHGRALVGSLIEAGFTVIYRPHPLLGQRLAAHGEADTEIRRLVSQAGHRVSVGGSLIDDFDSADVLITDVSAVANDWLVTGRPLLITRSAVPETREAATKLLEVVPRITSEDAANVGAMVQEQLADDPAKLSRHQLLEYYLGDTTPGASLDRFLKACAELAALRDVEWARIRANEIS